MSVIDMKTRSPWRIEQHKPTEAERTAKFVNLCADNITQTAIKIAGAAGIDAALRTLQQACDDVKKHNRRK